MATTYVSFTVTATGGSGSVTNPDFSYAGISLLTSSTLNDIDQLVVFQNSVALTPTTDYTVNEGTSVVTISSTIASGDNITIERVTAIESPLVVYVNNALIDKDNLNDSVQQLLYRLQEISNDVLNTITLDITTTPNCWDAQDKKICNLASGTLSTDAVNLGQVTALISGSDPMDVSDALYADANGDNSTTDFVPQTDGGAFFPTTDVNANKIIVTIDGVVQRPGVDYSYTLNASSRPQVSFLTGAPPTGSGNVQFRTFQGVVTSTYAAASLDGSVIVDGTLDGDALIDGSVDGDKLTNGTVPISKLEFADTAEANRFIVVDASEVASLTQITHDNITHTGSGTRTDITDTEITEEVSTSQSMSGGGYTWTNSGSKTLFVTTTWRAQHAAGTVRLQPSGGAEKVLYIWQAPGGAIQDMHGSFFVPPGASVNFYGGTGDVVKQITSQEI